MTQIDPGLVQPVIQTPTQPEFKPKTQLKLTAETSPDQPNQPSWPPFFSSLRPACLTQPARTTAASLACSSPRSRARHGPHARTRQPAATAPFNITLESLPTRPHASAAPVPFSSSSRHSRPRLCFSPAAARSRQPPAQRRASTCPKRAAASAPRQDMKTTHAAQPRNPSPRARQAARWPPRVLARTPKPAQAMLGVRAALEPKLKP